MTSRKKNYNPAKRAEYYRANKAHIMDVHRKYVERCADDVKDYRRQHHLAFKTEVLTAYGGPRCSKCPETRLGALTVDHISGNGNSHRAELGKRGASFYRWLRDQHRVLCSNCNVKEFIASKAPPSEPRAIAACRVGLELKTAVVALGGMCVCGIADIDLLTVHHTNNDGATHRRLISDGKGGSQFYRKLLKSGITDDLECRCFSCNDAERLN